MVSETSDGIQVVTTGKSESPESSDYEEMVKARMPLSSNPRKAAYLTNRACGFSIREACTLAGVSEACLRRWRREDSEFDVWERERLKFMQETLVKDLEMMEFHRNMRLVMAIDKKLLYKGYYNMQSMSDVEVSLLKVSMNKYKAGELVQMNQALGTDNDLPPGAYRESYTVTVEGREVDTVGARQAAARKLLVQFTDNKQEAEDQGLIEGEVLA